MANMRLTTEKAMGNAFISELKDGGKMLILCDTGIMGIYKALREKCLQPVDVHHINNIEADRLQQNGIDTYIIKTD